MIELFVRRSGDASFAWRSTSSERSYEHFASLHERQPGLLVEALVGDARRGLGRATLAQSCCDRFARFGSRRGFEYAALASSTISSA